jgi:hypothetical protein
MSNRVNFQIVPEGSDELFPCSMDSSQTPNEIKDAIATAARQSNGGGITIFKRTLRAEGCGYVDAGYPTPLTFTSIQSDGPLFLCKSEHLYGVVLHSQSNTALIHELLHRASITTFALLSNFTFAAGAKRQTKAYTDVTHEFVERLLATTSIPTTSAELRDELEKPLPPIILPESICGAYGASAPAGVSFVPDTTSYQMMLDISCPIISALSHHPKADSEMAVGDTAERHTTDIWTAAGNYTTMGFAVKRNTTDDTEATVDNKRPDTMTHVNKALMAKVGSRGCLRLTGSLRFVSAG